MSTTLSTNGKVDERPIGAAAGTSVGMLMLAAGVMLPDGTARETTVLLGWAVSVVGTLLGWVFARRAMRPGLRSALSTAARLTVIALPLGALAVGSLMAMGADGLSAGEVVVAAAGLSLTGLVFFGLPLGCLTFVLASIWVGVLRMLVRQWRGGLTGAEAEAESWSRG